MRRLRLLLILAVAGLVLGACQVESVVRIDVAGDGSGTVTVTVRLDRDAAQRLGDPLAAVRLDDLRAAGWSVEDPSTDAETGVLTYRAQRAFAAPEELAGVLGEVGGGDGTAGTGIFGDVQLEVTDGFGSTDYAFSSDVELTGSLEQLSDPDLTAALGGLPLARTPEELAAEGAADPTTATLEMQVALPGSTPESNGEIDGDLATWEFPMTGNTPTSATMTTSSSVSERRPLLVIGVGVVLLVLAVAAAAVGLVRRRG